MTVSKNFANLFREGLKVSKNLSNTVRKAASNTIQAKVSVSEEKRVTERLAICEKCPSLIKPSKRCAECGCFVSAKTQFEFEECPLGKW
jgi:hypothetical protein